MNQPRWENYDITRGESIRQGYFAALEVVMRRYISEMESYFFDQFKIHCAFDFSIQPNRQFNEVLKGLPQPCPIFRFTFSPLRSEALLVMDNRLANLILHQQELKNSGQSLISNHFLVTAQNYGPIESSAQAMLNALAKSWGKLAPAKVELNHLVAHRVKAKVLSPTESTVTVRVCLKYKNFKTGWDFCFSAYELDPLLKKYGNKALLTGYCEQEPSPEEAMHLENILLNQASYEIKGTIGEMNLSQLDLQEALQEGTILPIESLLTEDILLTFNGEPLLSGQPGESLGKLAVQINGPYLQKKNEAKNKPKPFKAIRFPKA